MTRRGVPPLWRAAPSRMLRDPAALLLTTLALAVVALTGAAGPLHGEAVDDGALRTVLAAVPDRAPANQQPVVRLNAGVGPGDGSWDASVDDLSATPGLAPVRVTAQSISPETHPRLLYAPVGPQLRSARGRAPVRLFAVADPADVVTPVGDPVAGEGLWLPEPVAADLGLRAGDTVRVRLSNLEDAPRAVAVPVAGVYAVGADGRTPVPPPGVRLWDEVGSEGFPTDAELSTLRAHLAVADVATVTALAGAVEDDLLWSAVAPLADPRPRLAQVRTTALGVRDVRRDLTGRLGLIDVPASLRPGLASGLEDLVLEADALAAASRRGTAVATRAGLALALGLVLAATGFVMSRRRREVELAAGVGRHPASAGALHVVELLPAAVVGGAVGWLVAEPLVGLAVPDATPSGDARAAAAVWALVAVVAGLGVAALGAAWAARSQARVLEGRTPWRVPWLPAVVVAAASACAGLLTRPAAVSDPLGPLDLLVPPLLVAAGAAVGTRFVFVLLRRRRRSGRRPRAGRLSAWLLRRRLGAPDPSRELATTVAAVGLGLLVYSVSALVSLEDTVTDRTAVEVGADTVLRVGSSWALDPDAPVQAELGPNGEAPDPDDVPEARIPPLPDGLSLVWRSRAEVATTGERVDVLAVDPDTLGSVADWGTPGGPVDRSRALLDDLRREDAGEGAPVPALLVGSVPGVDLEEGSALLVDTRHFPVALTLVGIVPAFPGVGSDGATVVVDVDTYLARGGNDDPRLSPASQSQFVDTYEFPADLWAAAGADPGAVLDAAGIAPDPVGSVRAALAAPTYVAGVESRRYQVGLGLLAGLLGLVAVALGALRSARRAPAADRMLALAGARPTAPARARLLEVVVVVLVCTSLALLAVLALRPLGAVLVEPGGGGRPAAALRIPVEARWFAAGWVAAAITVALGAAALATVDQTAAEVLRGED